MKRQSDLDLLECSIELSRPQASCTVSAKELNIIGHLRCLASRTRRDLALRCDPDFKLRSHASAMPDGFPIRHFVRFLKIEGFLLKSGFLNRVIRVGNAPYTQHITKF